MVFQNMRWVMKYSMLVSKFIALFVSSLCNDWAIVAYMCVCICVWLYICRVSKKYLTLLIEYIPILVLVQILVRLFWNLGVFFMLWQPFVSCYTCLNLVRTLYSFLLPLCLCVFHVNEGSKYLHSFFFVLYMACFLDSYMLIFCFSYL